MIGREPRRPGARWRFQAHTIPDKGERWFGPPLKLDSRDCPPSIFDELVIDQWFHIEQMTSSQWWVSIAGLVLFVDVDNDGNPVSLTAYAPGDYDEPRVGCEYGGLLGADE